MWRKTGEILNRFLCLCSHLCWKKDVRNAGFSMGKTVSKAMGKMGMNRLCDRYIK